MPYEKNPSLDALSEMAAAIALLEREIKKTHQGNAISSVYYCLDCIKENITHNFSNIKHQIIAFATLILKICYLSGVFQLLCLPL